MGLADILERAERLKEAKRQPRRKPIASNPANPAGDGALMEKLEVLLQEMKTVKDSLNSMNKPTTQINTPTREITPRPEYPIPPKSQLPTDQPEGYRSVIEELKGVLAKEVKTAIHSAMPAYMTPPAVTGKKFSIGEYMSTVIGKTGEVGAYQGVVQDLKVALAARREIVDKYTESLK